MQRSIKLQSWLKIINLMRKILQRKMKKILKSLKENCIQFPQIEKPLLLSKYFGFIVYSKLMENILLFFSSFLLSFCVCFEGVVSLGKMLNT